MAGLFRAVVAAMAAFVLGASPGWAAPVEQRFPITVRTTLVAGRSYTLTFRLYDAPRGGTVRWQESRRLRVPASRAITHLLGSVKPFSAGAAGPVDFSEQLWVQVSGGGRAFPRLKLNAVPYALSSGSLPAGTVTSAMIADGAVDDAKIGGTISAAKIQQGSGSALNADLIDGLDSSAFAASGHAHDEAYYTKSQVEALVAAAVAPQPIVMTESAGSWAPATGSSTPTNFSVMGPVMTAGPNSASSDGVVSLPLTAPVSIGGTSYRLSQVEYCVGLISPGVKVTSALLISDNYTGSVPIKVEMRDDTDRTTVGCYTIGLTTDPGARAYSLVLSLGYEAPTTSGGLYLRGTRSTWVPL